MVLRYSRGGFAGVSGFLLAASLAGCATAKVRRVGDALPLLLSGQQRKLIWAEEFNGAQLDPAKSEILGDAKRRDGFWTQASRIWAETDT